MTDTNADIIDNLESTLEDIDDVTKRLKVSIPAKTVEDRVSSTIGDLSKTVELKGFRKGKAPKQMVEQLHGSRVRMEVANRLIENTLHDLIKKHKIDVFGSPEIDVSSFEPGEKLEYTANISIFPSPTIKGYESFTINVPVEPVSDKDVDQVLSEYAEQKATLRKLEFRNKAEKGDVIDATVIVTVEGETPSKPEPLVIDIGSEKLPPELEAGILGMEVGTTKEVESRIPADHANEKLRGKTTKYTVSLSGLSEKVLPELTDDFVAGLNLPQKTLLELKIATRDNLEKVRKNQADQQAETLVLEELRKRNEFAIPQAMVDDGIRRLIANSGLINTDEVDVNRLNVEPFREKMGEVASNQAKNWVILDKIASQENIKVEDADLEERFQSISQSTGINVQQVKTSFRQRNYMVGLVLDISRQKAISFLMSRAKITHK